MKAVIGGTVFPHRLSQLFADTKKSYENVVQTRRIGAESSSLHLKLRIQKDRLIAWGILWSDRSAAAPLGDIDGSLDRAGISDLVTSIMCSIRELLDEAEALQPSQTLDLAGDVKLFSHATKEPCWTVESLKRLEEILTDLTTSIDTLCDLSRPRVEDSSQTGPRMKKEDKKILTGYEVPTSDARPSATSISPVPVALVSASTQSRNLSETTFIEEGQFRLSKTNDNSGSSPPSYESVATGTEVRSLAYLSTNHRQLDSDGRAVIAIDEQAVLLDYNPLFHDTKDIEIDEARFEELWLFQASLENQHGILRLKGWTVDKDSARYAYVYEVPETYKAPDTAQDEIQPRSLLSFLQNGGDADSDNIPSLENRFRLALNITSSIMALREKGLTHGNISSNNVVFFVGGQILASNDKVWKGPIIRAPYLTSFHQTSWESPKSVTTIPHHGKHPSFSSIYQHPCLETDQQQSHTYRLAHDLYSLGLVLLEIGLWMPIGKFWKSKYTRRDFQTRLQNIYLKKLSAKCGEGYMRVVLFCMTQVDRMISREQRGQQEQGNSLHSDFHESVIVPLTRCCLIDSSQISSSSSSTEIAAISRSSTSNRDVGAEQPVMKIAQSRLSTQGRTPYVGKLILTAESQPSSLQSLKQTEISSRKIKVWSHEIPGLYSKYWTTTMFPKLERILLRAISRWESYTIDLFMAGEDADTARPTVYMECTSTAKVRKILRHLNKELRLFEIKVVSGQIVRSKAGKKKRKNNQKSGKDFNTTSMIANGARDRTSLNSSYQKRPACGASIGAFRNGSHLPPVSYGGAVLVDGEPYGMSVHHMLEDDDEIEIELQDAPIRSILPRPTAWNSHTASVKQLPDIQARNNGLYPFEVVESAEAADGSSEGYAFSDNSSSISLSSGYMPEALYPFEISEDECDSQLDSAEDEDFWLSPDFDNETTTRGDNEDSEAELGDTLGIQAGYGLGLIVTQPAIDDVNEGFFPSEEDKDEEHLSSHALGHIHASSGIKRSRRDDIIHEVDWALIKVREQRIQACNIIHGGGQYCKSSVSEPPSVFDSYPCKVMKASDLGGLQVHASGRTSGLQTGTILPTMRMIRMPGRSFASHSWQVRGNFGGMLITFPSSKPRLPYLPPSSLRAIVPCRSDHSNRRRRFRRLGPRQRHWSRVWSRSGVLLCQ